MSLKWRVAVPALLVRFITPLNGPAKWWMRPNLLPWIPEVTGVGTPVTDRAYANESFFPLVIRCNRSQGRSRKMRSGRFLLNFLWNLLAEGGKRSVIDKLSTHTDGAYHWRAARNGKCLFLTSTSWNNSFFMAIDIVKLPMVYLQNELKRRCCCMNVMDS